MRYFFEKKKEKLKYHKNKENSIFMIIISYKDEKPVQFGITDANLPYVNQKKVTSDILARYYEDGRGSYMTHKKGEFLYSYERPFVKDEEIIMLYRPSKKDKLRRDHVIFRLLYSMKIFIEGRNKLLYGDTQMWGIEKEVINEHIRKNNIILFELERLIDEYCFTGV